MLVIIYVATKNEKDFARYLQFPEFPKFIKINFIGKELVDIDNFGGKRLSEKTAITDGC